MVIGKRKNFFDRPTGDGHNHFAHACAVKQLSCFPGCTVASRDVVNRVALRPFAPEKPYVFRIEASTTLCTYARIASVRQVSTDALT
jgi:hypothetical protein